MGKKKHGCKGGRDCSDRKHLCKIAKKGKDFDGLRELVRGARFVCLKCGRAARDEGRLCRPAEL